MDVESTMLPLGTKMPNFNLLGIDEKIYTNEMFNEKIGSLVMFICNHCPFVKHVNDEIVKLTNEIMDKNCLLYTSPSPRDRTRSRMPSSA